MEHRVQSRRKLPLHEYKLLCGVVDRRADPARSQVLTAVAKTVVETLIRLHWVTAVMTSAVASLMSFKNLTV